MHVSWINLFDFGKYKTTRLSFFSLLVVIHFTAFGIIERSRCVCLIIVLRYSDDLINGFTIF